MHPRQTPIPGSNPRRKKPPSILSPSFKRSAFAATATASTAVATGGGQDAAVSEHPCITMLQWWLAKVEGDDERIAVAGVFERNNTVEDLAPALIAKRHEACVLETEDGIVLLIYGSPNISRTLAYGYSTQVCEKFMLGFPYWWQSYNQLYPKEDTSSNARCPLSSSNNNNSKVDSKLFYLRMYQVGERLHSYGSSFLSKLNSVNSPSNIAAAFQKSSHLPNGAPRFEEYASNGHDVPNSSYLPNENAAASNNDGERDEAVCIKMDNVETDLTSAVECANDASNEEYASNSHDVPYSYLPNENAAASINDGERDEAVCIEVDNVETDLTSAVECANDASNEEYASNSHDVPDSYLPNENAAASNNDGERDEAVCFEVDNVETDLTSSVECANDTSNEEADTAPSTSDKRTPMVSLKMQGEEMPTSVCLDVQISSDLSNETPRFETNTCIGDIPTNGDAAASNDNSERCTTVPDEVISIETVLIVDSDVRERGLDDITTNVSLAPTVECVNDATNEEAHNSLLGCKQTPVASLKSQGCQEKHPHTPSSEKPSGSGPPKKKRSAHQKSQGATRSPFTSPVPYAHESPLTRGRITSLSMSTPEALKLRKTRSGRVVVPSLDAGCQRIVYGMDGTIAGVVGLDLSSPKGSKLKASATKKSAEPATASKLTMKSDEPSKLKTYARKRSSAEPAAASKLKTYARKKRRAE